MHSVRLEYADGLRAVSVDDYVVFLYDEALHVPHGKETEPKPDAGLCRGPLLIRVSSRF
jgi:hypothetical protein